MPATALTLFCVIPDASIPLNGFDNLSACVMYNIRMKNSKDKSKTLPLILVSLLIIVVFLGVRYYTQLSDVENSITSPNEEEHEKEDVEPILMKDGYVDVMAMGTRRLKKLPDYNALQDPYLDEPYFEHEVDIFDPSIVEINYDKQQTVAWEIPEDDMTIDLRENGRWPAYEMSLDQLKKDGELFDLEEWALNPKRIEKKKKDIRASFFTYLMKLQKLEKTSATTKFIGGFGAKINSDINPYFGHTFNDDFKEAHEQFMDALLHEMILVDKFITHPDYALRGIAFYRGYDLMGAIGYNKYLTKRQKAALIYTLGEWHVVPNIFNASPQRQFGEHKDQIYTGVCAAYTDGSIPESKYMIKYGDLIIKEQLRKHDFRGANFHRLVSAEYHLEQNKIESAEKVMQTYDIEHEYSKSRRLQIMKEIKILKK